MVACGGFHTLVVTRAGLLFAFGRGAHGQLGLGDRTHRDVPVEVGPGRFGVAIIVYAAAGTALSGVVTSGGGVWTSQYNYILVVGKEEVAKGTVNVRTRDNVVHGEMEVAALAARLAAEIAAFQ